VMRRIASRSPTTGRCGRRRRYAVVLDDLPGVGPARKRACFASSVRPARSARRASSRSPRCPASDRAGDTDQGRTRRLRVVVGLAVEPPSASGGAG
jgi:hypothetical protein